MNNKSKTRDEFEEDEIFDDSSFLAKLDNTLKDSLLSESKLDNSLNNNSNLNVSALCCDEEISGYDKLTGKTWIYPTNYPVRDYQFNIINSSILKNTLVSLPTGLGKTFIAAVIMYNFYRWYPLGKIIFTAPTRPLVAQQIEACYNIIAIPPNDTIEMTGHMQVNTRKTHWQSKRVFFATPQVIYNDIKSGICPADKIRCLVLDEAHRAKGNYAYCQIVSTLTDMGLKTYRILALSATPGSKIEDVISVIKSLHIAHLELRTENCIDVAPYSHSRKINTVVIPLGPELTQMRQLYVEILDSYARRLKQFNILPQNLGNLSKGRIVMLYKEFQNKDRSARHPQHNYIMKDFTLLIALYHGLELLVKHGTRVFLNFFDEHPEKSWIQSDDKLTVLLERLRDDLGINPLSLDRSVLPDGTIPEIPKTITFGHPKFYKLKEIMLNHFTNAKRNNQDTRAIVFCEYRESVNLVHCLLLQCRPLITPQMFVGQGASGKEGKAAVSQKQQLRVMRSFRAGGCNALAATCVAEEGLDVGSVDLIVCFDISSRSPVRLVQRCGRTGRERGGQVYILVTEGREHQTLLECMRQRDGLNKKIMQSTEVSKNLYKLNPRMMPHDFKPVCQKMFITVAKKNDAKEKKSELEKLKKGQKDLRTMLLSKANSSSSGSSKEFESSNLINEEEFNRHFPIGLDFNLFKEKPLEMWAMNKESIKLIDKTEKKDNFNLSTWLEWQRSLQKTVNIEHSVDTNILTELLQYSDAKRFQLPTSSQNPTFNTQDINRQQLSSPIKTKSSKPRKSKVTVKQPQKLAKSPGKRDGDIRALFSTATKSTKNYTKHISDLGIQNNVSIPTRLLNLIVDLSLDNGDNTTRVCYICQHVCDCTIISSIRSNRKKSDTSLNFLQDPKFPNINLIDDFDLNLINLLKNNYLSNESQVSCESSAAVVENDKNSSNNFDLGFDFNSLEEIKDKTPDRCIDIMKEIKPNFDLQLDLELLSSNIEYSNSPPTAKEPTKKQNVDENFEIGDLDDIFAESSPEEIKEDVKDVSANGETNSDCKNEALGFFGLDSIEDIFADYDDSTEANPKDNEMIDGRIKDECNSNFTKSINVSPSILSGGSIKPFTSPILCSQAKKCKLSIKKKPSLSHSNARRQLIKEPDNESVINTTEQKYSALKISFIDKDKSMLTITQLVESINKPKHFDQTSKNETTYFKNDNDRSTSPILLTQADKKKNMTNGTPKTSYAADLQSNKNHSLIILDSDSESSDNTQVYELDECISIPDMEKSEDNETNKINCKRKFKDDNDEEVLTASPYFKKQKLSNSSETSTLREKLLSVFKSNKIDSSVKPQNDHVVNSVNCDFSKENKDPQLLHNNTQCESEEDIKTEVKTDLSMLQMFRRDNKVKSPRKQFNQISFKTLDKSNSSQNRHITFDDSDDSDFEEKKSSKSQIRKEKFESSIKNHKIRKKRERNEFLDLEAEVSGSGSSGDELSDASGGSLQHFICDDRLSSPPDMHAHYVQSVRSPVKGVFKIPQLPSKFNKMDVLSQFVEEDDSYEMDSFCVDSHIGLTQVNDMSELELAEIVLEEKRRKKKRQEVNDSVRNKDSPVVRRKNKIVRRIESDSEDST